MKKYFAYIVENKINQEVWRIEDKREINEEELYNLIIKDCEKFLKEFKNPVYRGMKGYDTLLAGKFKRIHGRKPTDMSFIAHEILDNLFFDKFNWRVRSSGVFTMKSSYILYGNTCAFFPIGDYEYVWSPFIDDLYSEISCTHFYNDYESYLINVKEEYQGINEYKNESEWEKARSEVFKRIVNTYKKDGQPVKESETEMVFNVDYYYLIRSDSTRTYPPQDGLVSLINKIYIK